MRLFYIFSIFVFGWMCGTLALPPERYQGTAELIASLEEMRKPELDYVDSFCGDVYYEHIWTAPDGTEMFEIDEVQEARGEWVDLGGGVRIRERSN